jgi:hypothetical protein
VRYLEDRIGDLEARATERDDKLIEILTDIRVKLDDLHREWVGV